MQRVEIAHGGVHADGSHEARRACDRQGRP